MPDSDKKTNNSQAPLHLPPAAVIFLSLIFGFVGGWLAVDNRQSDTVQVGSGQQIILNESQVITEIAERVAPSVVSINVTSEEVTQNPFFGPQIFESSGAGSGIILTEAGLVVTNKHVIPETTSQLEIVLADGRTFDDVDILGRDPFNDIAFLKINGASDLTPAVLGDSDNVRVGEKVIAIGNALGRFDSTVTSGIISGMSRPVVASDGFASEQLQDLFQTDAAINPGNSGGPLLNASGEVIGINTAVAGGAENIGFAIPINQVRPAITSVQDNGRLIRPYLGVRYVLLNADIAEEFEVDREEGALIISSRLEGAILPDSPADKAGLQEGDIIVSVEGTAITQESPLVTTVSQYQVGETITLEVQRGDETLNIEVTLEEVPDSL